MSQHMYTTTFGESFEATLMERHYQNGDLAIQMVMPDNEPYGVITTALPGIQPLDKNCVFLDENNFPGIGEWLESIGVGTATCRAAQSGFCVYPEYRINTKML